LEFNSAIVRNLRSQLARELSIEVVARKIEVFETGESREERDVGSETVSKDFLLKSVAVDQAKVWLCERQTQLDGRNPENTGPIWSSYRPPKLDIPKWREVRHPKTRQVGGGLRAPFSQEALTWLDLKGGFVEGERVFQPKSPALRAKMLHDLGWT
jgi:hypothetical protein